MQLKNFIALAVVLIIFLGLMWAIDLTQVWAFLGIVVALAVCLVAIGVFSPLKKTRQGHWLLLLLLFASPDLKAQTTVNFSACANGSAPGVYQTINFTGGPWLCEQVWLFPNVTLSWSEQTTSSSFKFTSPEVLTALTVGDVGGLGGTLTITTDQGQSFSAAVPASQTVTLSTGFTLAATTVTVQYTDSWFLEISSLTYAGPPPPGISAKLNLTYDNGTVFAGSAQLIAVTTTNGVITNTVLVSSTFDATGTVSVFLSVNSSEMYNVFVVDPNPPSAGTCPATESLTTVINNEVSVQECVVYSAPMLVQGFLISNLKSASLTAKITKASGQLISESYAIQ